MATSNSALKGVGLIVVLCCICCIVSSMMSSSSKSGKEGDECTPIKEENKVENVEVYKKDSNLDCKPSSCIAGYNLTDGQCELVQEEEETVEEEEIVEEEVLNAAANNSSNAEVVNAANEAAVIASNAANNAAEIAAANSSNAEVVNAANEAAVAANNAAIAANNASNSSNNNSVNNEAVNAVVASNAATVAANNAANAASNNSNTTNQVQEPPKPLNNRNLCFFRKKENCTDEIGCKYYNWGRGGMCMPKPYKKTSGHGYNNVNPMNIPAGTEGRGGATWLKDVKLSKCHEWCNERPECKTIRLNTDGGTKGNRQDGNCAFYTSTNQGTFSDGRFDIYYKQ